MNTELLIRLARIQTELNAIMIEIASTSTLNQSPIQSIPVIESEKKSPGRPRKEKKERDPNKPKKVLSPEHLAKLKEGRERRAAEKTSEKTSEKVTMSDSSDDDKSVTTATSSDTEEGEIKSDHPPPAPKKIRGRPHKNVEPILAPDFSAAESE